MKCTGDVVYASKFTSKKGKEYTRLLVPIGFDVVTVIADGDRTDLAGVCDVVFSLAVRDGQLKLYLDKDE